MPAPNLSIDDLLASFQRLLPRGLAWPREADAVQTQALRALMPTTKRQVDRSNNLLVDAFPASTLELLPEWELTLGLPDPCAGATPTIENRRAQVKARFAARGGQSAAYFIQFAANLGYAITITTFSAFYFGNVFGGTFGDINWNFAYQVNAPTFTITSFQFGAGTFGEPFAQWDNTVLQCELQRIQPGGTYLLFKYS
jgi:uncharacterized protein YmfQ (DUF2313 family)